MHASLDQEKPILAYLRPKLNRIPPQFHDFLVHNLEILLNYYFRVVLFEDEINDQDFELLKNADMLLIQNFPEIGLNNFPVKGLKELDIPKVGFLTVDSISPSRYDGLAYFKELELDAYFSPDVSLGLRYPAFRDKIFYLPWFISSDNVLPAPQEKNKQFLLVGHSKGTYPWRNSIFPALKEHFLADQLTYFKAVGKEFIKILSEAKYVPTDGGFGRILVNKHLEIPAANSCIIIQPTEITTQMGFIDKVNCLMAEDFLELKEKVAWCEADEDRYKTIIENGRNLVLSNHTEADRSQLLEYYLLCKKKADNQKIIQPTLFGKLELTENTNDKTNFCMSFTDDSLITAKIDDLIKSDQLLQAEAECDFLINNFSGYSPDFLIRNILIQLRLKNYEAAAADLWNLFNKELQDGKAIKPDPNEWSLFLLTLMLTGRKSQLKKVYLYFSYEQEAFFDFIMLLSSLVLQQKQLVHYFAKRLALLKYSSISAHMIFPQSNGALLSWFEDNFANFNLNSYYLELKKMLENNNAESTEIIKSPVFLVQKSMSLKIIDIQYIAFSIFKDSTLIELFKNKLRKTKKYFSLLRNEVNLKDVK